MGWYNRRYRLEREGSTVPETTTASQIRILMWKVLGADWSEGRLQRGYDMNGRSQRQEGKNWILPKEISANRFF